MAEEVTNERSLKRVRSPNYPSMSLVEAVQQIQKLLGKIGQHPAPREAVATSMGYSGLHGASATAISALIKYGLLDRAGEDYKLSERAMRIVAPHNQHEKLVALEDASREPALFAELIEHFKGEVPGDDLFRSYLLRKGFAQAAIPGVIGAYRDTMDLVTREGGEYLGREASPETNAKNDLGKFVDTMFIKPPAAPPHQGAKIMEGERELTTGLLSKNASFRLIVSGEVGVKEIERLIAKLELDKKILADSEADTSGGE
jgi:hypothetical protein